MRGMDELFFLESLRSEDVSPQPVFWASTWGCCGTGELLCQPGAQRVRIGRAPLSTRGATGANRVETAHGTVQSLRRRGLLKPSYLPAKAPCLNCSSLSARAPCLNGRVEPQNPIVWTVVQLLPTRLGVFLFAWVAQYASTL